MLDMVISADDQAPTDITVVESGLSDHKFIKWTTPVYRPRPPYIKLCHRTWKHFSLERFTERIELSPFCQLINPSRTATELALCYQLVLTTILDDLAPVTEVSICPRLHRPFYDAECQQACRRARRLEKAYRTRRGASDEEETRSF